MNKYLIALLSAGLLTVSTASQAAEPVIDLAVTGHMQKWVGYAQDNPDDQQADVQGNTEIYMRGKATLSNGLIVGADVQLEGDYAGIDESYAYIQGSLGKFLIGKHEHATSKLAVNAPDVGIGINTTSNMVDQHTWLPRNGGIDVMSTTTSFAYHKKTAQQVSYYTPRLNGVQIGLSYAPDTLKNVNEVADTVTSTTLNDQYALGLSYQRTLGSVEIDASAGYITVSNEAGNMADDPEAYNMGLTVGISNLILGGSYVTGTDLNGAYLASFDAGASLKTGKLTTSVTYFEGRDDDGALDDGEERTISLATSYAAAPGVKFVANLGSSTYDQGDPTLADNSGEFFVVGTKLKF
ncbi:MAG: porin [Alphaproteobacteria bacterium]